MDRRGAQRAADRVDERLHVERVRLDSAYPERAGVRFRGCRQSQHRPVPAVGGTSAAARALRVRHQRQPAYPQCGQVHVLHAGRPRGVAVSAVPKLGLDQRGQQVGGERRQVRGDADRTGPATEFQRVAQRRRPDRLPAPGQATRATGPTGYGVRRRSEHGVLPVEEHRKRLPTPDPVNRTRSTHRSVAHQFVADAEGVHLDRRPGGRLQGGLPAASGARACRISRARVSRVAADQGSSASRPVGAVTGGPGRGRLGALTRPPAVRAAPGP